MGERYIVMYSGGICSWAATRRLIEARGGRRDGITLLFADTKMEDPDLYRFVRETAEALGVPVVTLADGRNPWQVFVGERFIGNSRVDPCSKILKRQLMDSWRDGNCDPGSTTLVFGLDWSERGRIEGRGDKPGHRARISALGWTPVYPMDWRPYLTKAEMLSELEATGIEVPALYRLGFPHNNCGGFCVKMGLAQARHLLATLPGRYRWHEEQELAAMEAIGPTARPFLRLRSGGKTRRITLAKFREMVERQPMLYADHGWGCGGGCAIDDEPAESAA